MPGQSNAYELLKKAFQISTSSLPIEKRLEETLRSISEAFQADRCFVVRPEQIAPDGFWARLAAEKKDLWTGEEASAREGRILPEEERLLSPVLACLYLSEQDSFQGLLCLGFPREREFLSEEGLLLLLAKGVARLLRDGALHLETARLVRDHEKSVNRLATLHELNKTLLVTVQLERTLELALTAITVGEGLGFNRAMLFLVDEKRRLLKGSIAVGPDSAEEAGRIWSALSRQKGSPSVVIPSLGQEPKEASRLDRVVKETEIPLDGGQCVLAKTVLEGRPFHIQVSQSEEGLLRTGCEGHCCLNSVIGCYEGIRFSPDRQSYAFATVPLWGKGRVIGVVLVDNVYNRNPIDAEDLQFLSMFANEAGRAIENALLYRNLEEVHRELKEAQSLIVQQEKMAALGELSNTVAHEIKNPLTAIGGFARRLDRAMAAESPEKRYTRTIIEEVARLEKLLTDINHYTHTDTVTLVPQDLSHLLEDSLSLVEDDFGPGKLRLIKEFPAGIPEVLGDAHQLKHAFYHLINNACESMDKEGTLSVRLYPYSKNGTSYVRLEVKDTGKGIEPDELPNIFNPFYSTKKSGSGFGLPIVHRVIVSHQGQIEVDNRPGEGVTFIVTFPAFRKDGRNPT
jgi:hypothetical protein